MPKAGSDPGTMRVTSLTHAIFLIGGQQNGAREKIGEQLSTTKRGF